MPRISPSISIFVEPNTKFGDLTVTETHGITSVDSGWKFYVDIHTSTSNVTYFFESLEDIQLLHAAVSKALASLSEEVVK